MIRWAIIACILIAPLALAFAVETQHPPCVPVSVQQMTLVAKSEPSVVYYAVYRPHLNIFKAMHDAKTALSSKTVVQKVSFEQPKAETVAVEVVPVKTVEVKPMKKAKVKSKPRACPVLKGNKKCKRGRWQSLKHSCKCGIW